MVVEQRDPETRELHTRRPGLGGCENGGVLIEVTTGVVQDRELR
jgi:hypothetical protein